MKNQIKLTLLASLGLLVSCGGNEAPTRGGQSTTDNKAVVETVVDDTPASERITLDNKGVGTVKNVTLDEEINQEMAARGEEIYKTNCTACHKPTERFIGPAPMGIFERRSPEWIMNMILDPQLMVEQDRCAMDLLVEFNGAAMANQNLTEDQARDILEYFRTL